MSRERMQEHFSELFEGTIDPGLGQQIKNRLDADYDLNADYKGFMDTMQLLETMKDETFETPQNLSSMIADRIETGGHKPSFLIGSVWRSLGFGALACVAIAGAVMMIKNRSVGGVIQGGAGPVVSQPEAARQVLDTFEVKTRMTKPVLEYSSSGPKTVTILNQADQKLVKKYSLDGNRMSCPLENPGEEASILQVEATGDAEKHYIVLPGSNKDFEALGQGDLLTFAKLLATKYRSVVHIQVQKDADLSLKWDVSQSTAKDAAKAVLGSSEYTITGNEQILVIQSVSH